MKLLIIKFENEFYQIITHYRPIFIVDYKLYINILIIILTLTFNNFRY